MCLGYMGQDVPLDYAATQQTLAAPRQIGPARHHPPRRARAAFFFPAQVSAAISSKWGPFSHPNNRGPISPP